MQQILVLMTLYLFLYSCHYRSNFMLLFLTIWPSNKTKNEKLKTLQLQSPGLNISHSHCHVCIEQRDREGERLRIVSSLPQRGSSCSRVCKQASHSPWRRSLQPAHSHIQNSRSASGANFGPQPGCTHYWRWAGDHTHTHTHFPFSIVLWTIC